jgi:hypothetical protein
MGKTVVVYDLEGDSKLRFGNGMERDDAFKYSQITVACALVLDADQCMSDPQKALAEGRTLHWWRDMSPLPGQDPFDELLTLFDEASLIVAYNGLDYDFKMLLKHYSRKNDPKRLRYTNHRLKCLDMFANLRAALGKWPKLDALLMANGLASKTASGLEAITMWEEQRRDELLTYCEADVWLLAELSLKEHMIVPDVGRIPGAVYQIQASLTARQGPVVQKDDAWELVD